MLIGQVGKDREINAIFGKTLRILGHPEFLEPVRNLLHRGLVACASSSAAGRVYPTLRKIEGRFLIGLVFLPNLLAVADWVSE